MSQRGQMTIEMMMLMIALLGVGMLVARTAQEQGWVKTMVAGPWKSMQGMIEDGVWMDPRSSRKMNPATIDRHGSLEGDAAP